MKLGCDFMNHGTEEIRVLIDYKYSGYPGRQGSRILMKFCVAWQTKQSDFDWNLHITIDKTVGFRWDSLA